ncbi:hypothetical protein ST47_g4883 [Ascochyta rabiei]|uniref:Uncharacterized protein n=1 Tax=Didymella rabiei TaxID=5454 RepID=A0A163EXM5_DIDRA|nr:hypothetical protein ST47_g4883 [Ascochyta rabiei]
MLFSRLFTLVVLALTSPAFLILEGQEEGIYAVKYIDGRSVHTNIANATVYRHFPESYFKPEASRNSRSRRNHNRSICDIDRQCGNGSCVGSGLTFYAIGGDIVAFYCNFGNGSTCTAVAQGSTSRSITGKWFAIERGFIRMAFDLRLKIPKIEPASYNSTQIDIWCPALSSQEASIDTLTNDIKRKLDNWSVGSNRPFLTNDWKRVEWLIQSCLSERVAPDYKLQFHPIIAFTVTCLISEALMFYIAYSIKDDPHMTTEDAIWSCVDDTDATVECISLVEPSESMVGLDTGYRLWHDVEFEWLNISRHKREFFWMIADGRVNQLVGTLRPSVSW